MYGILKFASEAEKALNKKVFGYLKENYPEDCLQWVKGAEWSLQQNVPLDKIKMSRRPGGARETDKVKGIAGAVKEGKPMDPVVLVLLPDGTYKIADGYHRTLGFKHAGKNTINAYVGKTDTINGPWDKEMHEKKLNVGKAAYEHEYGLAKLAAPGGLLNVGKKFVGGLTGYSKKKANKALTQANERRSQAEKLYESVPTMQNQYGAVRAKSNQVQAQKAFNSAKRNQTFSRATAGTAAVGGVAAADFNKHLKEQEMNQMQMQPQMPPIRPLY